MTSLLLVTMVNSDLLMGCFQMTMTISLLWKVQQFPIKNGHQDNTLKLGAQRFQTFAPLCKVEPFGHKVFSLISVKEVGGRGDVVWLPALSAKQLPGTATNQSAGRHSNLMHFCLTTLPNVMGISTRDVFWPIQSSKCVVMTSLH